MSDFVFCDEVKRSLIWITFASLFYLLKKYYDLVIGRDKWNKLLIEEIEDNIERSHIILDNIDENISKFDKYERCTHLDKTEYYVTTVYKYLLDNGNYYDIVFNDIRTYFITIISSSNDGIEGIREMITDYNHTIKHKDEVVSIDEFDEYVKKVKENLEDETYDFISLEIESLQCIKECQEVYTKCNRFINFFYRKYMKNKVTEIIESHPNILYSTKNDNGVKSALNSC